MTSENKAQREHPAYRLAVLDQDFLLGDSTRGVRFLLEYAKAEERLRSWVVKSTIVVFGSARLKPGGSASRCSHCALAAQRWAETW